MLLLTGGRDLLLASAEEGPRLKRLLPRSRLKVGCCCANAAVWHACHALQLLFCRHLHACRRESHVRDARCQPPLQNVQVVLLLQMLQVRNVHTLLLCTCSRHLLRTLGGRCIRPAAVQLQGLSAASVRAWLDLSEPLLSPQPSLHMPAGEQAAAGCEIFWQACSSRRYAHFLQQGLAALTLLDHSCGRLFKDGPFVCTLPCLQEVPVTSQASVPAPSCQAVLQGEPKSDAQQCFAGAASLNKCPQPAVPCSSGQTPDMLCACRTCLRPATRCCKRRASA